nr:integrase, catalytic region, zinc finger, CCHC-type, peptidase aspartic, catalytic [Tanacetum cinerariifolium]
EKANQEKNNESLTDELERYKERVKTFKRRLNMDLSTREKMIDSQMDDMIKEKPALKRQIDSLEQNLFIQIKENESLLQTFIVFKNESKEKEKTLILEEVSRSKMLAKQNDPISKEKKINTTPINYVELNHVSEDSGKRFVPQEELSAEQAFWLQTSNPNTKIFDIYLLELKLLVNFLSDSVNLEMQRSESCDKCSDLDAKILKNKNAYNELLKSYTQLAKHYLKAQIQDNVFVITSLKNDLRKLKGKEIVDNVAQIPNTTTIVPDCSLVSGLWMLKTYDKESLSAMNFVSKFLGTIRFGNDKIAKIMGYGDYQLGNITI